MFQSTCGPLQMLTSVGWSSWAGVASSSDPERRFAPQGTLSQIWLRRTQLSEVHSETEEEARRILTAKFVREARRIVSRAMLAGLRTGDFQGSAPQNLVVTAARPKKDSRPGNQTPVGRLLLTDGVCTKSQQASPRLD